MYQLSHTKSKAVMMSAQSKNKLLNGSIGSLIKFTNNNYSTYFNKENTILINQQFVTNKKKSFVSVKNYSTSNVQPVVDGNNSLNSYATLDPIKFESWSREEVCSLLVTDTEEGGADMDSMRVQPLFDAGFNGKSLSKIVDHIQEKDKYFAIKQLHETFKEDCNPWNFATVVNWVDTLFKTRLCHLWSVEEVRNNLCKPIKRGGAGLIETKFNGSFLQKLSIGDKGALQELTNVDRNLLMTWIERNKLVTLISFEDTSFAEPLHKDLPYQNNKDNVKLMAKTLLENKKNCKFPIRYQQLLVNSANFGSGKTRLGLEFLSLWKQQMNDNPSLREEYCETFGKDNVAELENSKIVYIDCRSRLIIDNDLDKTLNTLKEEISKFIGGDITRTPCYIVIDEIRTWVLTYKPTLINGLSQNSCSMFEIFHKFILPLQKIPTVSLYICGTGVDSDIVGEGKLRMPTEVVPIHLEVLTKENTRRALTEFKIVTDIVERFKSLNLFDYVIDEMYKETKGVPYYIVKYIINVDWKLCTTSQDIDRLIKLERDSLSDIFKKPFEQFSRHPVLMGIYQSLLYSSLLKLDFNSTLFNKEWISIEKFGSEVEGINPVDSYNTASMLYCFVQPKSNGKYELLFPQVIIDEFTTSKIAPNILLFSNIVEKYGPMLSSGDVFERQIILNLVFRMRWGTLQGFGIGEVIPFLKDTELGNVKCSELLPLYLNMKLMDNENTLQWKKALKKLDWNRLGIFKDHSHSCDKVWKILVEKDQSVYVMIHNKNLDEYPYSKFLADIEKNEKIRKVGSVGDESKLIMVFLARSSIPFAGRYDYGVNTNMSVKHKNTFIIVLNEREINDFFGEENRSAVEKLSDITLARPIRNHLCH